MEKRKSLIETNGGQKFYHRHPKIIDTQSKSNHTVRNVVKSMPKMKFNINDKSSDFRSISSPRLKSFPAEEMRKITKSPRPNVFPFPVTLPASPPLTNNAINNQGDSITQSILPPMTLHNRNETMSQPFLSHATSNQAHHSDACINCNSTQQSSDQQPHRPFVPNIARSSYPKSQINSNKQINKSYATNNHIEDTKPPDEPNIQLQNDCAHSDKAFNTLDCEKQPVGGRNAAIHRMIHLSKEKKPLTTYSSKPESQNINHPHQNSNCHHQYQQQAQPFGHYYNYNHPQQQNTNNISHVAMTTPQNLIANQVKNHKNNFNHYLNQQLPHPTITEHRGVSWHQSMIPNNSELHHNCQHEEKIPGNNQYVNNSLLTQHQQEQEYPPRRSVNNHKNTKKNLQFTPEMIHDQELLVIRMRQQGISEDIMKRQFDTLLNEQRRQLIYQQRLEQMDEKNEECDDVEIPRRRRITKIEQEEKPEWMIHITPPWIPYALVEKMKNNLPVEGKKCVRINENFNQQQQWQEDSRNDINIMANNYQWKVPLQNVDQQWPQSIGNDGYQHENFYYQAYCNPTPHITQHTTNADPISILKSRNDDSAIITQKRQTNNGLQDLEMVKKVMEELKNTQNHRGFEYLVNLNKKEQNIKLNGIQEPDDPSMRNLPYRFIPENKIHEVKNELSANGLENKRNLNNPPPPPILHSDNYNLPISEYPKQKINKNVDNGYFISAEKDNELITNSMFNGYQQHSSAFKNSAIVSNPVDKNLIQAQVCCQAKGRISGPDNYGIRNKLMINNSLSPNMHSEYQPISFNDIHQVPETIPNNHMIPITANDIHQQYLQPNIQMQSNIHVPEQFHEARVIGGIQYFARKNEYKDHANLNEAQINNRYLNQPIALH